MRARLIPAGLAGLLLLVVLLASAPARLFSLFLPPDQVVLQGLTGTLWRGAASRAMIATDAGYLHLGHLQWHMKPLSLLLLSPAVVIDSAWGGQQFSGELRRTLAGNLHIDDAEGRFDAAVLGRFLPVRLEGEIALQIEALVLRDGMPQTATGRLVWQGAGWQSPQGMRPLGSYAADLQTLDNATITGAVLTLSGDVQAEGALRWRAGEYGVDITLQGPGIDDPQLRQALQLMAAPEGDGFRLQFNGALPATD
ncbi:type II secretion system protein N [Haliea sp. E17]|uniref:type II secretion system protein N n=1 Tax=Haliea sp. E17 TaxID=3401576 RepID=UPI003AAFCE35